MRKINARTLLQYSTEELWQTLTGNFTLVFDDGEIDTNYKETIYSSYAWQVFHVMYPKTPLLKKHHVSTVLRGGKLGSKTHLILLGNAMWSVYDTYVKEGPIDRDYLARLVYETTNVMYNDLSYKLEEYVVSIDITDFLEITDHPDVTETLNTLNPDQASIDLAYNKLTDLLTDPIKLQHNPIVKASQAELVNRNQVLQCVGPRGSLTDIDSVIFPVPVMRGYVKGLRLFHDSLVESRSAAKSLYFSKDPLQDTEYFSRRLQLLCQIVQNLHHTDCGSTSYLTWKVNPPVITDGRLTYPGDLKHLVGKYYLNEETNTLESIKETDKHLYGKTLQIRSVVAGCAHPDPHGICSVCFGDLSFSVPENTNIGHMCATSMTQKSSQSVLSVKHLDGSSVVEGIVLSHSGRTYLGVTQDQNSYLINPLNKQYDLKLIINADEARSLTDINLVSRIEDLTITRVSEIEHVGFQTNTNGIEEITPVSVSINNRAASLTHDFLGYVKAQGWTVNERGNFCIDLKDWDFSKPFLTLPQKHYNMSNHSSSIATMIESRVKELTDRLNTSTPSDTLVELFELVNSKLTVNLAVLEVILYAAMVVSPEGHDYRLPKPWTDKNLGVASITIPSRSLSAALAYEYHRQTIVDPASFFNEHRPSHAMDVFIAPQAVIDELNRTNS